MKAVQKSGLLAIAAAVALAGICLGSCAARAELFLGGESAPANVEPGSGQAKIALALPAGGELVVDFPGSGSCRIITSQATHPAFVPLRSPSEWEAFLSSADKAGVAVSGCCRPATLGSFCGETVSVGYGAAGKSQSNSDKLISRGAATCGPAGWQVDRMECAASIGLSAPAEEKPAPVSVAPAAEPVAPAASIVPAVTAPVAGDLSPETSATPVREDRESGQGGETAVSPAPVETAAPSRTAIPATAPVLPPPALPAPR